MDKLKKFFISVGLFFLGATAFIWAILKLTSKKAISSETLVKDNQIKNEVSKLEAESKEHEKNSEKLEEEISKIEGDEEWHKKR